MSIRICLRCQNPKGFESEGNHNRICKKCKTRTGEKVLISNKFFLDNKPKWTGGR